jgi:hypothetical protein
MLLSQKSGGWPWLGSVLQLLTHNVLELLVERPQVNLLAPSRSVLNV